MCISISFPVPVFRLCGRDPFKACQDILANRGISIFVNGNTRGGVGHVNNANAASAVLFFQHGHHPRGNID